MSAINGRPVSSEESARLIWTFAVVSFVMLQSAITSLREWHARDSEKTLIAAENSALRAQLDSVCRRIIEASEAHRKELVSFGARLDNALRTFAHNASANIACPSVEEETDVVIVPGQSGGGGE